MLTAFALESHSVNLQMLDEVTADMRLDYPGPHPFRPETSFPEHSVRRTRVT
jgi:hypothetical protein